MLEDLLDLILPTEMYRVLMRRVSYLLLVVRVQMALQAQVVEPQQGRSLEVSALQVVLDQLVVSLRLEDLLGLTLEH
jgi:hypothetical protein